MEASGSVSRTKILIVVASEDRKITVDIGMFMASAMQLNSTDGCPFLFSFEAIVGVRGFAAMRNAGVKKFLDSDNELLWFIDNDIIPHPDVFSLPELEGDIVCAPYPWQGNFKVCLPLYKDLDDLSQGMKQVSLGGSKPYVDCVPMGCTIIRRHVLEDGHMWLDPEWVGLDGKKHTLGPDDSPPIFQESKKANGDMEHGDDHDFCIRARKLGYKVRADMTMVCGHMKSVDLVAAVPIVLKNYATKVAA